MRANLLACLALGAMGCVAAEGPPPPTSYTWTGSVDGYAFDDQTNVFAITLDTSGATPTGHIVLGERALYAPPTDPEVGVPPGFNPFYGSVWFPRSGFAFTLIAPEYDGKRLRFTIDPGEFWDDWCALQPSFADPVNEGLFQCLPYEGYDGYTFSATSCSLTETGTSTEVPIDCGKLGLCMDVCNCDASGCGSPLPERGQIGFDIALDGAEGDGSIRGVTGEFVDVFDVHVARKAPHATAPSSPVTPPASTSMKWAGYVENYAFDDGSGALAVTLDTSGSTPVGKVVFGSRALYAPPTDQNVGYPPGLDPFLFSLQLIPMSGFEFTMIGATYDEKTLRFSIDPGELWGGWCGIQIPILDESSGGYSCVHNWGESSTSLDSCSQPDPSTGLDVPIDCGKLRICVNSVCGCDANHCERTTPETPRVAFELSLDGARANGEAFGLNNENAYKSVYNVRLERQ